MRSIDRLNDAIGKAVAWLTLGCVLVCFLVVILRYVFSTGLIWLQEAYIWQHGIVFMVGAGYTLLHRGHVRVDILYVRMSDRTKAWVDIFGTVAFLFPWLIVIASYGHRFITSSWAILEPSGQPGGIPFVYVLKSMIWVFCLLVGLQGLAMIGRNLLFLAGDRRYAPEPTAH